VFKLFSFLSPDLYMYITLNMYVWWLVIVNAISSHLCILFCRAEKSQSKKSKKVDESVIQALLKQSEGNVEFDDDDEEGSDNGEEAVEENAAITKYEGTRIVFGDSDDDDEGEPALKRKKVMKKSVAKKKKGSKQSKLCVLCLFCVCFVFVL
jgi:hypothetical protein